MLKRLTMLVLAATFATAGSTALLQSPASAAPDPNSYIPIINGILNTYSTYDPNYNYNDNYNSGYHRHRHGYGDGDRDDRRWRHHQHYGYGGRDRDWNNGWNNGSWNNGYWNSNNGGYWNNRYAGYGNGDHHYRHWDRGERRHRDR